MSTPPLTLEITDRIATITIDRPPVNAFTIDAYRALGDHVTTIQERDDVSVVILAAADDSRCWCGGADLNDFVGMSADERQERYEFINGTIPRLLALDRPVIAAVTGHAIGIGVLLAAACDLRVASDSAWFSTPEIKYGLIAGSSRLLNYLGMPEALVREMAYTARRVPAEELRTAGFLNDVVPREDVLPTARALAAAIAAMDPAALRARKRAFVEHESLNWLSAYRFAQSLSKELVESPASREGVSAFFSQENGDRNDR